MTAQSDDAATPRTDAYPTKLVERSIDEALHPKGMSTHSGKVTLDASHVLHILAVSREIERELTRLKQELGEARAAIKDFAVIAKLHDKPDAMITIRQGLKVWTGKHADEVDAAREPRRTT
jgi:hypothetical protein